MYVNVLVLDDRVLATTLQAYQPEPSMTVRLLVPSIEMMGLFIHNLFALITQTAL